MKVSAHLQCEMTSLFALAKNTAAIDFIDRYHFSPRAQPVKAMKPRSRPVGVVRVLSNDRQRARVDRLVLPSVDFDVDQQVHESFHFFGELYWMAPKSESYFLRSAGAAAFSAGGPMSTAT